MIGIHPAAIEDETIFGGICVAEVTGCPLYIVDDSTARPTEQRGTSKSLIGSSAGVPRDLPGVCDADPEENSQERGRQGKIGPPTFTFAGRAA